MRQADISEEHLKNIDRLTPNLSPPLTGKALEEANRAARAATRNGRGDSPRPRVVKAKDTSTDAHYRMTEFGNAERLVRDHGDKLRYCHTWGSWLIYDGKRWKRDSLDDARRLAKQTIRHLYREAETAASDSLAVAIADWAKKAQTARVMKATLEVAQSEVPFAVAADQLDADPWLLNVENGTIDLRTGALLDHDRGHLITKLAPVIYNPDAEAPRWLQFLLEIFHGDPEVAAYFQRAVGLGLIGKIIEHALFFCHGTGRNGKSTVLNLLLQVLGDYARNAAPDVLMMKQGERHPTEIAQLQGVRLATCIEAEAERRMAEVTVKTLTGGDRLTARYMRQDFFEFTPSHTLFLAANHKPIVKGTDTAIWSRIHLVPFTVTIPPERQDKRLDEKLWAEAPGVLAWAVAGCLQWQQDGLQEPKAVRDATASYRSEMDVLGAWIEERCIVGANEKETAAALYTSYTRWCEGSGEEKGKLTRANFGLRLAERGFVSTRSGQARKWLGLRLAQMIENDGLTSDVVTDYDAISDITPNTYAHTSTTPKSPSSLVTHVTLAELIELRGRPKALGLAPCPSCGKQINTGWPNAMGAGSTRWCGWCNFDFEVAS